MDPLNLDFSIHNAENNGGFPATQGIPLWDFKTSGALTLTAGTTPVIATTTGYLHINWAASDSAVLLANVQLGGEFDPAVNEIFLDLAVNQTGTTDTITVNATMQPMRAGHSATGTAVAGTALTTALASTGAFTVPNGATAGVFTWKRLQFWTTSNNQFQPNDQVQILITPSAHTSDALFLGGAKLVYVRNACLNSRAARFNRRTATP